MRTTFIVVAVLLYGCAKPMTREEQVYAYKTCQDAGKRVLVIRDPQTSKIIDVECEP